MADIYGISERMEDLKDLVSEFDVDRIANEASDFSGFMVEVLSNNMNNLDPDESRELAMLNTYAMMSVNIIRQLAVNISFLKEILEFTDNPEEFFEKNDMDYMEVAYKMLSDVQEERISRALDEIFSEISEEGIDDRSEIVPRIMQGLNSRYPDSDITAVDVNELLKQISEEE